MEKEKVKKDGTVSNQGIGGGRPMKFSSPEELIEYAENFFKWCEENKKRPTVTRLAYYLKCDRISLLRYEDYEKYDWLKSLSEEEKKKYSNAIKDIKRRIEAEYEDSLFYKGSVTGAIFTLKNNYDWVDKQEVVNKSDNSIEIKLED